jgi:hypothetical protein
VPADATGWRQRRQSEFLRIIHAFHFIRFKIETMEQINEICGNISFIDQPLDGDMNN